MTTLVIDASVAIKWVIDGPGTDGALALRQFTLSAPDLLIAECANILWKKSRRQEITEDEAVAAAKLLAHANIELMPMRPLFARSVALSVAWDRPAYDCVYLALAEATESIFITADDRLLAKLRSSPGSVRAHALQGAQSFLADQSPSAFL